LPGMSGRPRPSRSEHRVRLWDRDERLRPIRPARARWFTRKRNRMNIVRFVGRDGSQRTSDYGKACPYPRRQYITAVRFDKHRYHWGEGDMCGDLGRG